MTRTLRPVPLAMLFFILAGCPNGPGGGSSGPIAFDDYVTGVAETTCAYFDRCGLTDSYTALLLRTTTTDCRAQLGAYLDAAAYGTLRDAIAAGRIVYHADRAGPCLDAYTDLPCGGIAASGSASTACANVFEGTVDAGGACTTATECAHGALCSGASGTTCGTCSTVAQIGEACGSVSCSIAAVCLHGVCRAPIGVGGACETASSGCLVGLTCQPSAIDPAMGTCAAQAPGTIGMPCSLSASCAAGLVCGSMPSHGSTTSACRAPRTDGTCQLTYIGATDCSSGMVCVAASGGTDGTCMPTPTLGQTCTSICTAPARCGGGTCVVTREVGESCTGDPECLSNHCTGGVCVATGLCRP